MTNRLNKHESKEALSIEASIEPQMSIEPTADGFADYFTSN